LPTGPGFTPTTFAGKLGDMLGTLIPEWVGVRRPVIGMLHAPPLPGAPRCSSEMREIAHFVLRDAETLVRGGVHGLLLENFGDAPFTRGRVSAGTVAAQTTLAIAIRGRFDVPLGINVLRNDALSALAIAVAVDAVFIRVNVLTGARLTDQGIIQGNAYALLRERARLRAEHIPIFADVNVKHSVAMGAERPIEEEAAETLQRGGADGLIVSGVGTGRPADIAELRRVKQAAGTAPVLVGSGVDAETVAVYAADADGFIVGTAFKQDGLITNPVDERRVAALLARLA